MYMSPYSKTHACRYFLIKFFVRSIIARDNIFVDLVKHIYATDTPTNVLPSIHVFNSLGVCIAIRHSEALKKHKSNNKKSAEPINPALICKEEISRRHGDKYKP